MALAARRKEQLEANVATIGGDGAIAIAMDVTDPDSVERGVAEIAHRLGPATIVVNIPVSPLRAPRSTSMRVSGTRSWTPTSRAPGWWPVRLPSC